MKNKINLITGETYTLRELCSGKRSIIIPDLQRDYCWGNPVNESKEDSKSAASFADGFIDTLLEQFNLHPHGRLSLGLLYGYESPENHVQLCDGQQRITTLFLLVGMLNRWVRDDRYRHYLMSDSEFYEGGHTPYLQYSIRESSLYFMSDLVYRFFSNGDKDDRLTDVKSIYDKETGESCAWFYGEYATDPSILSMLRCLKSIENKLASIDNNQIEALTEFLVDRLTFIYYDMETRANGEETFVVINTTGDPLTGTENLKPLVLSSEINYKFYRTSEEVDRRKMELAHSWEEMENFFWRIRRSDDYDTADNGFNEFLRWVTLLWLFNKGEKDNFKQLAQADGNGWRFPHKEIPMTEIIEVFKVFVRFRSNYSHFFKGTDVPGQGDTMKQAQLFTLLPLLAYLRNHPTEDSRQVVRLWKWLENLLRIDNISKSINEVLFDAVLVANSIDDVKDIVDPNCKFNIENISATLLTEEELFKLQLLHAQPDDASRCDLEKDIWTAQDWTVDEQDSLLFKGEIRTLLLWAHRNSTPVNTLEVSQFIPAKFKHYLSRLKELLKVDRDHTVNDLTRRALLSWGYEGLPYRKSYGWKGTWKNILAVNPLRFRDFIDIIEQQVVGELSLSEEIKRGLNLFINPDHTANPIALYPGILAYSNHKNFDRWQASGLNVCINYYALPIPLVFAVIMAKAQANVQRNLQYCGDWTLYITKEAEMVLQPVSGAKRVKEIKLALEQGGTKLKYDYIFWNDVTLQTTCPVDSCERVLKYLCSDITSDTVISRSRFVSKRCIRKKGSRIQRKRR